ncbi:MAG TPA: hypothetical protein VML96_06820 [Egibacteraceae bacterium]|nr:hypothetical protein [Egibacteraceae bacterium]
MLYILDDGPGTSSILAVSLDGQLVAELGVDGFEGYDTEALAVGECEPGGGPTCIYIGDIGDNLAARDGIVVYRIEEPDLSRGGPDSPLVPAAIHLRYPSGPVDAEALLVEAGVPYIVTKQAAEADGAGRARLYSAPGFSDGDLIDLGEVAVPEPAFALVRSVAGNVVTAGDSRPGRVLLRTYDHVVEYIAEDPGAPLSQFPQWPVREVESVRQQQGEAIAYLADECGYALVSEASGEIWTAGCGR